MRESSYGLPLGMYWTPCHSDEANGSITSERKKKWIERVIGEPLSVDPGMWRNSSTGDRVACAPLTKTQLGQSSDADVPDYSANAKIAHYYVDVDDDL